MHRTHLTSIAFAAVLALFSGCVNLMERTDWSTNNRGPYYCTSSVWSDCVCAPANIGNSAKDPILTSFATLTWPFWVVDLPCEAALDTVFLPWDLLML